MQTVKEKMARASPITEPIWRYVVKEKSRDFTECGMLDQENENSENGQQPSLYINPKIMFSNTAANRNKSRHRRHERLPRSLCHFWTSQEWTSGPQTSCLAHPSIRNRIHGPKPRFLPIMKGPCTIQASILISIGQQWKSCLIFVRRGR